VMPEFPVKTILPVLFSIIYSFDLPFPGKLTRASIGNYRISAISNSTGMGTPSSHSNT
jgi:hypothetical protein